MKLNTSFRRLGVVGAGSMGAGIAQKMAMEGFAVTLVDTDEQRVSSGLDPVRDDPHSRLAERGLG